MKNIHILPTDKPSRLYLYKNKLGISNRFQCGSNTVLNQNIYITSDEEIKEGDWFFETILNKAFKCESERQAFDLNNQNGITKIILTTDQDLIKDGVQAIDDEFLEFIVKNPSCEKVEVEKDQYIDKTISDTEVFTDYIIIIPQEEKTKCYCGHTTTCDCGPETLEEAAEIWVHNRFTKQIKDEDIYASESSIVQSHILFYKWQQERSYSEEDMIEFANFKTSNIMKHSDSKGFYLGNEKVFNLWFEQFKKK